MVSVDLQIQGHFDDADIYSRRAHLQPAPMVTGRITSGDASRAVEFQIDTGADTTTVCSRDAARIWGEDYLSDSASAGDTIETVSGVSGPIGVVLRRVGLSMAPLNMPHRKLTLELEVVVLPPSTSGSVDRSMLGRDILNLFDVQLSYPDGTVTLSIVVDDD